jgi:hypothetical protein
VNEPVTQADKKTPKQLRAEAERSAAVARAELERKQAEEELRCQEHAKEVWKGIWHRFGVNMRKSPPAAFSVFVQDMAENSADLVPWYFTATEFVRVTIEASEKSKGSPQHTAEDPRELFAAWIRGEIDISRVPLEKLQ